MGLLDMLNSEQGMLGLSLLAAAAPQAGPRNTGAGLLQALGNVQQFRSAQDAKKAQEEERAMRRQQFEMQQQQLQQAMAEQARMAQQREADNTALRGQFGALPGPTMDGSQLRRGFDPARMLQSGASPQAVQQAMQLDQIINPRAKPSEFKEVSGNLLRIGPDGQVTPAWTAPEKPKDPPTAVQEYNFAQQQGYKGSFQQWVTEKARAGAASTTVSLGSPVPVTLPNGETALVQPANKPGQPPQIMTVPGTNTPLRPQASEAVRKEMMSINQQNAVIDGAIQAAKKTPSAFGMTRGLATMAGSIPESVAGRLDSDAERQARAFVFNNVSAVINERAGAAQSAQELARLRSFLPAETDNAAQIDSKLKAFKSYLADKERGTNGRTSSGQPSLEDLLKKYGN